MCSRSSLFIDPFRSAVEGFMKRRDMKSITKYNGIMKRIILKVYITHTIITVHVTAFSLKRKLI